MLKRPHYIVLGLVVLLTIILLNLPSRTSARLKLAIGSVFLPLFGLASASEQLAGRAADSAVTRKELLKQNELLRRENQELKLQTLQLEEVLRENSRLRQHLAWQQHQKWELKLGNVVLREPANWWRNIQINLGSRNGLSNNLAVLSPQGFLVGRVDSVGLTSSHVVLLGDPNCKVAARVDNETRDTGIIGASGPMHSDVVEMGFLSRTENLKPGQLVRTSGDGGVFPKDIIIGKILDAHPAEYGLSVAARITLAADLNTLDEVWVRLK